MIGESVALEPLVIRAQPGPQEAFLTTEADIAIYGGAAGGGKTYGLLLDPIRYLDVKGYGAVFFRRTYPDIVNVGGMWDESQPLYSACGGRRFENRLEWKFAPHNTRVRFSHLQHEWDVEDWKGSQIPCFAFDQLETFTEKQFFYLLSRNRSTCGVKPYIRATVNPPGDPEHWILALLEPWIGTEAAPGGWLAEGELARMARVDGAIVWVDEDWRDEDGLPARTVTFISAALKDNPALLARDPEYAARLRLLPMDEQRRLLGGEWWVPREGGGILKKANLKVVDEAPADLDLIARSWDLAGTEPGKGKKPDHTAGPLVGVKDGHWYVCDMERTQEEAADVDALMDAVAAADGWEVPVLLQQDPGETGKRAVAGHKKRMRGYDVRSRVASGNKFLRARPFIAAAQAGNVSLVRFWPSMPHDDGERSAMAARASAWHRAFVAECTSDTGNDDQWDAVSWALLMLAHPDDGKRAARAPSEFGSSKWIRGTSVGGG